VFVYISTYMHTETTCVWVYIYICVHQVYGYVCTPSLDVREHIFTYMHAEFTCVCVYVYIYVHRVCTCVYVSAYMQAAVCCQLFVLL